MYIYLFSKNKTKKTLKCNFTLDKFYVLIELQIVQKEIFFVFIFIPYPHGERVKMSFSIIFLVLSIFFLQFILCVLHVGLFVIKMKSLQLVYISR